MMLLFSFPLLPLVFVESVPLWIAWLPVGLFFLGFIAVPIALGLKKSSEDPSFWPDLLWLWGNDSPTDKGVGNEPANVVPDWWLNSCANGDENKVAEWFPQFWWYVIRNKVNNHRFVLEDREPHRETDWNADAPMEPQQLRNEGQRSAFMWSYNGFFASYRRVWLNSNGKYSEFWIGWKVGSTVPGMGFTTQIRLKRNIGQ